MIVPLSKCKNVFTLYNKVFQKHANVPQLVQIAIFCKQQIKIFPKYRPHPRAPPTPRRFDERT